MSGYSDWRQQVIILAQAATGPTYSLADNEDFLNSLPMFSQYAEARMYKELIFLATRTTEESAQFVAGNAYFPLALLQNPIIVVEGFAAITPVGSSSETGTRWEFDPVSLDMVDMCFPTSSITSAPTDAATAIRYWAMYDNQTIKYGPTMDAAYTGSVTGIFSPTPLSEAENPDTYLTLNWMPQFIACSMISVTGWMRNYGAQSDDPKMSLSWQEQYTTLRDSMMLEEQRRKGAATGWSPMGPTLGTPPRT